eukprot:2477512-Pleurochrysis_carterae.AAC.3
MPKSNRKSSANDRHNFVQRVPSRQCRQHCFPFGSTTCLQLLAFQGTLPDILTIHRARFQKSHSPAFSAASDRLSSRAKS